MARQKTAKQLEEQLKYAKAREAYKKPEREQGAPTRRSPKFAVAYKPMAISADTAAKKYKVQVSKPALTFFGQDNLNTPDATSEDPLPRGAQPAKVHAMVADATPSLVKAEGSKRPYIRYGKGTKGSNSQYTYTAAFSIQSVAAMDNEIKALFTAVKEKLGGPYGRVWYEPEKFVITGSGE